ncbi:uncharacterized protein CC84DRAFT_1159883 [Paraphaeosphaeria sporulosa]|uniref:Uncharacterized protein n=1 Tax=Paraphaeosphaeria sporulosa TaxID=1460663 RepID=A0A177CYG9_9PLEO|nr:uncharacterized protein CC84DRAFT_1159883 [Paraphaeosphaeria sporulosa]OAG12595.1 hypothetical protein CC84DRAFT_1159883 [Paraphaeosphaeria sporulosa]
MAPLVSRYIASSVTCLSRSRAADMSPRGCGVLGPPHTYPASLLRISSLALRLLNPAESYVLVFTCCRISDPRHMQSLLIIRAIVSLKQSSYDPCRRYVTRGLHQIQVQMYLLQQRILG